MKFFKILFWLFALLIFPHNLEGKTYVDKLGGDVHCLFQKSGVTYIIRYEHAFADTLRIPNNCEIKFEGGRLSGPIIFKNTSLKGNVNLKGSSVHGHIANKLFDASWLCAMDAITDDARNINEILEVCDNVFFPRGIYRLKTVYSPQGKLPHDNYSAIRCHLGINKSNVSLRGEKGTIFYTDILLGTICVYTYPNQIPNSISNIKIENITFKVVNDGKRFSQFMHTIKLIGVNGITIRNCRFDDFWGDAICLSHYEDNPETGERTRNQKVRIIDNVIIGGDHHNNRNGISVINGKNVLIKGNVIKNTSRKDMPGAIDIEPNNTAYTIDDIRVYGNVIEGCGGTAGGICVNTNEKGGPANHIYIEGNTIRNSTSGLAFVVKCDGMTSDYIIKNNFVDDDTTPYQFIGEGGSRNWTFIGNTFLRPCRQEIPGRIKVANLVLKRNKKKVCWIIEQYTIPILSFIFFIITLFVFFQIKQHYWSKNDKD